MPSKSIKSNTTVKTVKTVDDVFSILEDFDADMSLTDTRDKIKKITADDSRLQKDSIGELHNPLGILAPVSANAPAMLKSMFNSGAILGGVQATSFFYPLCHFSDAPWDFFCSSVEGAGDNFVNEVVQFSGAEIVENLIAAHGVRVVYLRRSANGIEQPVNIRIYISADHPIQMVLNHPMSYQHSYVTAVGAVCIWPRITARGMYRSFESNKYNFPTGKTRCSTNIKKLAKTSLKKPLGTPQIHTAQTRQIETVVFENKCGVNKITFDERVRKMQNPIYAVSDTSTKYLGDVAGM